MRKILNVYHDEKIGKVVELGIVTSNTSHCYYVDLFNEDNCEIKREYFQLKEQADDYFRRNCLEVVREHLSVPKPPRYGVYVVYRNGNDDNLIDTNGNSKGIPYEVAEYIAHELKQWSVVRTALVVDLAEFHR